MIKCIKFNQYRKLVDIDINFNPRINVISGTNGTCKSTLMHLISNSFQAVNKNDARLLLPDAITILNTFTDKINPKIETISRSDKGSYKNPASGVLGTLFTVEYTDDTEIEFRRHNSRAETQKENFRFAIKPPYRSSKKDTLPSVPVVYLGLSRLFPYGELSDNHDVRDSRQSLPDDLHEIFVQQYKELTGIEIVKAHNQNVSGVKKRSNFISQKDGIDSNTISAGEDNIGIILIALNCLRNYYENLKHDSLVDDVESLLLIDEFDSTLHPSMQVKLLDLISEYSEDYRIQVFFTTHSLYLLKYAYQRKHHITYLIDQIEHVEVMPDPDPLAIEMHLNSKIHSQMYNNVFIPVYTEDAEARIFLDELFDYIGKVKDENFPKARTYLHEVNACLGSDVLIALFKDKKLNQSTMKSICILDGDQKKDLSNHIITLPGKKNPEKLLCDYAKKLHSGSEYRNFWSDMSRIGYSRSKAKEVIDAINKIEETYHEMKSAQKSTKGFLREEFKDHFNEYEIFYRKIIAHWISSDENANEIKGFLQDLYAVFMKTAPLHGIGKEVWPCPIGSGN